jgi:hypothetical protein
VEEFLKGRWADRSERFVLCTSASVDRTQLEETIETLTDRLEARRPPIAFDVWDAEAISERLRLHRDIVSLFFGPHWTRLFFGEDEVLGTTTAEITAVIEAAVAKGGEPHFVSSDWAPLPLRPRLDEVRASDPKQFAKLTEQFGNPPEPPLVVAATRAPPPWLKGSDDATWDLLARIAEALGEWLAAARAWERVGAMRSGTRAASAFAHAATAADVGGDADEARRLLKVASEADNRNARVVLAHLDDHMAPGEQLALLEGLQSDDAEERGLIAARRAVAHLLSLDIDAARADLEEVRGHIPGSALIDGLEVSIAVQSGRLAVIAHRLLDRGALLRAAQQARSLRDRLRAERRFSESTRMVMLEADSHALLGDRKKAASVLRDAIDEECVTQIQKEVLAESAADRALDFDLALELLADAEETPTVLRLRLQSLEETGLPHDRERAVQRLDRFIAARGPQAPEAALHRLAATLGPRPTPWSDDAAVCLRLAGHERAAVTAQALFTVRREGWEPVERLLQPYGRTPWALAAGLRAALHSRVDPAVAAHAAREVLSIGPGHALRVDAARGLMRGREFTAARETLVGVARDPNAPDAFRGDAFDLSMRLIGFELDDWTAAGELHDEWVKLMPADTRAQSWAPTVANRRRRQRG